jgi:hypothetical protein
MRIRSVTLILFAIISYPSLLRGDIWTECSDQSMIQSKIISTCTEILSAEWARGYQRLPGALGGDLFKAENFDLAIKNTPLSHMSVSTNSTNRIATLDHVRGCLFLVSSAPTTESRATGVIER